MTHGTEPDSCVSGSAGFTAGMRLPSLLLRGTGLVAILLAGLGSASAATAFQEASRKFLHKDVDVITVTDLTPAGRSLAPATPQKPVYCKVLYFGYMEFAGTRAWAGEKIPGNKEVLKWMLQAMQAQGYLVADQVHPAEQMLVFSWGMMEGGKARPALGFLGGDKVNLMWEQQQYGGFVDPKVLLRGMIRAGIGGKIWDIAESDLFIGVVRSYTLDSLEGKQTTQLWETRFACPATGIAMTRAMPLMVTAAAAHLGRETDKPVSFNASTAYEGKVTLGEFKVLGDVEDLSQPAPEQAKSR